MPKLEASSCCTKLIMTLQRELTEIHVNWDKLKIEIPHINEFGLAFCVEA